MTVKRVKPAKVRNTASTQKIGGVSKIRRKSADVYGSRTAWMELRERVIARDGRQCRLCHCKKNLQVDHIRPAARGGQTIMTNLWTLCADCHSKRPGHAAAKHLILAKKK
jgi:5-methylcytosine-specific restriction endonuclease McrA